MCPPSRWTRLSGHATARILTVWPASLSIAIRKGFLSIPVMTAATCCFLCHTGILPLSPADPAPFTGARPGPREITRSRCPGSAGHHDRAASRSSTHDGRSGLRVVLSEDGLSPTDSRPLSRMAQPPGCAPDPGDRRFLSVLTVPASDVVEGIPLPVSLWAVLAGCRPSVREIRSEFPCLSGIRSEFVHGSVGFGRGSGRIRPVHDRDSCAGVIGIRVISPRNTCWRATATSRPIPSPA